MRLLLAAALLLVAASAQQPGTLVDAVVAVVNGHAITRSEAVDAAWFARLAARLGPPNTAASGALAAPPPLTPGELDAAVQHLVDERLLLAARADEGYAWATAAEIERQWGHWEKLAGGAAALDRLLAVYHLDAAAARSILRNQVTILDMLDLRLGGTITVGDAEIAAYYRDELHGAPPVPATARDPIAAILRQKKLNQAGQQWLGELRQAARIEMRLPGS